MTELDSEQLKLMVVDDEGDNLDLLYRTFRRDFEVFKADSGLKALQILEQQGEMAVIISDQRMPRMNGTEFLSRTVERFPDTIRILLTGYTDVEDLVGAINAGKVFKYITKPWNSHDLKNTVMQAADTYRVVKQRTNELHRALQRESIFNAVTTAIRESLDYRSILQTVVRTIGTTFAADCCWLCSVEDADGAHASPLANGQPDKVHFSPELFVYQAIEDKNAVPEPDLAILTAAVQTGRTQVCTRAEPVPQTQLPQTELTQTELTQTQLPQTQLIVPLTCQQERLAVLLLHRQVANAWSEEEIRLIEGVSEQAALAISQARLYQQIRQQTEQMRAELDVARQIQTYLLRQTFPELDTVKIQAHCFPAREVGGDFFETYVHPQGDIWVAVGDVSGKGVPAALFMASALSLLRRELSQEISPAPDLVMKNLNRSLFENLVDSNCFITMVLVRYRPSIGELVYANAGHIYPMVWSKLKLSALAPDLSTYVPAYLQVRGVPLGILPVWKAVAGQLSLSPGDALLLTSDGITEATLVDPVPGSTMLQQAGLWQLITEQPESLNLKDLLIRIQAQTQAQEDDQTILSLEVL